MTPHQACLYDLGLYLKDRAREAVKTRNGLPAGSEDRDFQDGRVVALNEAISIIQQTAEGLGIPLAELSLDDIVPDRDLT